MKRFLIAFGIAIAYLAWVTVAPPANANHPASDDGGVDIAFVNELNQPSFWEDYFGGEGLEVTCTKYEGHGGFIPDNYEAAVVKSGSKLVRVYMDPPSNVLGPLNPNEQHPNRRFEPPFSWVMKCNIEEMPTDTTIPEEETTIPEQETTIPEQETTIPEVDTTIPNEETTIPDEQETTSTTIEETTSSTVEDDTTSSAPPPSAPPTTPVEPGPPELPFTGVPAYIWLVVGLLLLGTGTSILRKARGYA